MNQPNKKRWIVIAIAALAAASAAFFVFGASKPEPLYQGRPVSFWIEQMGGGRVPGTFVPPNEEAWKAFSRTNQDALPFLIATLKARQPLRDVLVARLRPILPLKIATRLPLRTTQWSSPKPADFQVRLAALDSLNRIAPNDERFLSILSASLTDKHKAIQRVFERTRSGGGSVEKDRSG